MINKLDYMYTLSPDGVLYILLKRLAASLALPLYVIFNGNFKAAKIPSILSKGWDLSSFEVSIKCNI